jgi:O-antigen ligase
MVEFIGRANRNPPNWMQCLFQLRLISFLLSIVALVTLFINPDLIMVADKDTGIRLMGSSVAPIPLICPVIALISAHSFLHNLEPRVRSVFFCVVGFAGTLLTRSRGCELSLLLSLAILVYFWAKLGRRSAFVSISGFMISVVLFGFFVIAVGGERFWNFFNRGQDIVGIKSASGRTDVWAFVINYCLIHPWGMGYVAGFRIIFGKYYALGLQFDVTHFGNAHNSYMQVLADAGWLALAIYLIMIVMIVAMGWRFAKGAVSRILTSESTSRHAILCALELLFFCLISGSGTADYVVPVRGCFYFQNLIIAIILGASARMIILSRPQRVFSTSDVMKQ